MPYDTVANHPGCQEGEIGVVKEGSGELVGCTTPDNLEDYLAALHANESADDEELQEREMSLTFTRARAKVEQSEAERLLADTSLPVPFVASTPGIKADGKDLRTEDWDLSRYENYGPVLWVHDRWFPPLGRGMASTSDVLDVDVYFDEDDDFAQLIRGKAIKGMMAGSVGWDEVREEGKRQRNILVEFSMVPLGMDQDALPQVGRMYRQALMGMDSGPVSKEEIAAWLSDLRQEVMRELEEMMSAYLEHSEDEEERQEEPQDPEGTGTSPDGEPGGERDSAQMRAGAVLSRQNRDDLESAVELIQAVLARAMETQAGDEDPAEEPEDEEDMRASIRAIVEEVLADLLSRNEEPVDEAPVEERGEEPVDEAPAEEDEMERGDDPENGDAPELLHRLQRMLAQN